MLYGNHEPITTLKTYVETTIKTWAGIQFFLLVGPNGIGKSAHAQELIKEFLWPYAYSDFLYLKDYTSDIGKTHTIPVELNDSNKVVEFPDGSEHPNYGIRELNLRMQQSGFSLTKFVLIENIQRMSNSAMNAFLKTSEEPLPNRFIIATLPHTSQIIDTILSRCIAIHFDPLSEREMQEFAAAHHIASGDKELREILIAMAMGKPGMLLRLSDQISLNPELAQTIKTLAVHLASPSFSTTKKQQLLKQLSEVWLLQDFIDGWIAYGTERGLFSDAEKWLEVKRLMQANVNVENVLWYGVIGGE